MRKSKASERTGGFLIQGVNIFYPSSRGKINFADCIVSSQTLEVECLHLPHSTLLISDSNLACLVIVAPAPSLQVHYGPICASVSVLR